MHCTTVLLVILLMFNFKSEMLVCTYASWSHSTWSEKRIVNKAVLLSKIFIVFDDIDSQLYIKVSYDYI